MIAPATVIDWVTGLCEFFQVPTLFSELGVEVVINKSLAKQEEHSVWTFKTDHPKDSFGVGFLLVEGNKKLALYYTGDTTVRSKLKESVQRLKSNTEVNALVLVHESTFINDLKEESVRRKHSTIGEALEVGSQVGATLTVLTHFSGRDYLFGDNEFTTRTDFVLAHDFMSFTFADAQKYVNKVLVLANN